MIKSIRILCALSIAPLLHAATFRFDPPVPTNDTTTTVTLSAAWPTSCAPLTPPRVLIDGGAKVITLRFEYSKLGDGLCIERPLPFTTSVNLGVVPAGVYDLVAQSALGTIPTVVASTKLVVRDVKTFTVIPPVGTIAGGTQLRVVSPEPFDVEPIHVSIGGIEVPVMLLDPHTIHLTTPPHAAGAADLLVESVMGGTHLAPAAFTYYDPNAATPDPFVFAPLLFPIDLAGAGAFDAQWTTENVLEVDGIKTKLPVTGSAAGVIHPVLRIDTVNANSRIRDLSRGALNAGTEVPVVRENDFKDRIRLLNIPTGKNYRTLLRVWASGEPVKMFLFDMDQVASLVSSPAPLKPAQGGLLYGTADLTPFFDGPYDHLDVTVHAGAATRIWAMVSITNNDTQQVTVISPQ